MRRNGNIQNKFKIQAKQDLFYKLKTNNYKKLSNKNYINKLNPKKVLALNLQQSLIRLVKFSELKDNFKETKRILNRNHKVDLIR